MCGNCGCQKNKHNHIKIERKVMEYNDKFARQNRDYCSQNSILVLNLLASAGAGKTSFLLALIPILQKRKFDVAVIEGDQETSIDAEKIRKTGCVSVQVNTGRACHLDAHQIGHKIMDLNLKNGTVLFVENVGNLICPADFDLGEDCKIVFLSVAEGEEKPLKYPFIFAKADVVVITKTDIADVVDFDIQKAKENVKKVAPNAMVFEVSSKASLGFDEFCRWLEMQYQHKINK